MGRRPRTNRDRRETGPTDHADQAEADSDDRGAQATRRDPRQHDRLAEVGALRQRSGLGHGPRGLQRRRRGLGLPPPRPGPEQGLSLGRGRDRRQSATATSSSSSPRPSGTAATRSSRSGSSASPAPRGTTARTSRNITSTSTPRPSHSYMRFLYKYPQAEFPYEQLDRRERPARADRARVRAARHRHLRRGSLLRHRGRVRQGHDGRPRDPDQGDQPRARPAPLHLMPHLWFRNTWAWGPKPGPSPKIYLGPVGRGLTSRWSPTTRWSRPWPPSPSPTGSAPRTFYAPTGRHAAVHRQRDQLPKRLRPRLDQRRRPTSRTPSTARSSTARTASTPTRSAPSRPSTTSSTPSRPASPSPSGSA